MNIKESIKGFVDTVKDKMKEDSIKRKEINELVKEAKYEEQKNQAVKTAVFKEQNKGNEQRQNIKDKPKGTNILDDIFPPSPTKPSEKKDIGNLFDDIKL